MSRSMRRPIARWRQILARILIVVAILYAIALFGVLTLSVAMF